MKIKFLGTSSLEAIPRDDRCPQCLSKDPKDRRRRSAILVDNSILIDAGPDIKRQLSAAQKKKVKAVFITHAHEDTAEGLRDLIKIVKGKIYFSAETFRDLRKNFKLQTSNIKQNQTSNFKHQKNIKIQIIKDKEVVRVGVDKIQAIQVLHAINTTTFGYIVNNRFLYIQDILDTGPILPALKKVKIVAVDGSVFARDFGGHQAMVKTIKSLKSLRNLKSVYFTHNGHTHVPHKEMEKKVQDLGGKKFKLAYDNLIIHE